MSAMPSEFPPEPPAEVTTGMLWVLLWGVRGDMVALRADLANNVVRKDVYEAEKVAGAQQFELEKSALIGEINRLRSVFHWVGALVGGLATTAVGAYLYNVFSVHSHP